MALRQLEAIDVELLSASTGLPVRPERARKELAKAVGHDAPNELVGTVVDILPNSLVRLRTDMGTEILAHLSTGARSELVRLLPGERVRVEASPYNQRRGRILGRAQ